LHGPRDDRQGHGAAAGPTGPTGRRHANTNPLGPTGDGRGRRNEVLSMATIKNVCNKIERMSALQGWRMRWHMQ